ncbi:TRAP transporter solute receptor, TAXI family [Desulfurispirillum indicum S5]|uniref:TRAP transporter solute receptor, TAXI family n=1 Tax=Desulfurispirillum indicum (strain ATCC BAA-1389 / DSM 22839 / S5) TaxID=653733 RepID=E6W4D9_DESIS|nr:TAXI family TRAP transporter solute-binding subunit [Desulfurispirillum indicum]ADU65913.1 TRAP transporter solute receptor, TAXI family [Desulfurispirillum indicum S5]
MTFRKYLKRALVGTAAVAISLTFASNVSAQRSQQQFVTIGTGGVTGVYYPVGGAICRLVNANRADHGIRCTVESTGGSIFNLNSIRAGELDVGIVQSDWQYHAYHGTSRFSDAGPNKNLRALFSIHPEAFTVIARKDANATKFADLRGKRVSIGDPGSGQRASMDLLLETLGWDHSVFSATFDLKAAEQSIALCNNQIDAMVYFVGHPNGSIQEATTTCDSVIVEVAGEAVEKMIAERPYYRTATIPGGMYRGNPNDVQTFGVGALLVASTNVPENVVYQMVKSLFEGLDQFKRLHPALEHLDKESMVSDAIAIPLHPGAEKYFREVGLIK